MEELVKDPKILLDCSGEVSALLGKVEALKEANRLDESFSLIYPLEKKSRIGCDGASVSRLVIWVVNALLEGQRWDEACEALTTFVKKRQQLTRAIADLVKHVMQWLDKPGIGEEVVLKLIETLCVVTEGKIFVEVERARIILRLSKMKEDSGNIAEAANLLQEVQIETSISMEAKEKTDFMLTQMRLLLLRKDYIRCQIVCKRINRKLLDSQENQLQKFKFFNYMMMYHVHQKEFLEVSECMRACLHMPCLDGTAAKIIIDDTTIASFVPSNYRNTLSKWFLEGMILFALLAAHTPERVDTCLNINKNEAKGLQKTPLFKNMLEDFLNKDLIRYPPTYTEEVMKHPLLGSDEVFEDSDYRRKLYQTRFVQHNLIVVATYYSRVTIHRLTEMFDVSAEEIENQLCDLISTKIVNAKISRSTGIIDFRNTDKDRIDDWSRSITKMLDVLEEASNLLETEKLLQKTHASVTKTGAGR